MTPPRTLGATPQPVRLYTAETTQTGMARECVLLGRLAVEIVGFDGSVYSVMGDAVTGLDWLTDEDVRRFRASGDAERAKTHDARMRIESYLTREALCRDQVRALYMCEQDSEFRDAWAALLAAEDIEEHSKDEHGVPRYRLALQF